MSTRAAAAAEPPTHDELFAAWQRAALWRLGLRYRQALAIPLIRRGLELSAVAHRHRAAPMQPRLI